MEQKLITEDYVEFCRGYQQGLKSDSTFSTRRWYRSNVFGSTNSFGQGYCVGRLESLRLAKLIRTEHDRTAVVDY